MGERRAGRGPRPRTDREILANFDDVALLEAIGQGRVLTRRELRMTLRQLAREDLACRLRHRCAGDAPPPRPTAPRRCPRQARLALVGAPRSVREVVVAVLITLVVVAALNRLWRWSNHLAACAAGVAMLVVLFGAPALWSVLAVPAVAWARLALGRHTWSELIGGAVAGALVAATTLLLLR